MNKILLIAGATLAFAAAPLAAKPDHAGGPKGNKHNGNPHNVVGYGVGGCPPGLAKKNNGCMPPGQAKKLYNTGQRFPLGYGHPWTYNQIPPILRQQYGFEPMYNYYYGDGYLYRVDPKTMLISQVVNAILR